jgi:PAS domain S-box-containing protein
MGKHVFEDRLHMKQMRNLLARYLTVFLFIFSIFAFSQTPTPDSAQDGPEAPRPFQNNVRTILLLTSYPVADVVTSNFFDSYRKGIRELNLPIDCHVVELNATHKGNEDRVESTFARLEKSLNQGLYSIVVTLNHEAANVIMRNYDRFPRTLPVLFAGLGRMPVDLKRQYPNSTGIGITDDTLGTVELGLKLFPEAQNLALVTDETTISEETRNEILSNCKLHFPQLDYKWINSLMPKQEIQSTLATLSPESLILFFPTHDYANGHNETVTAFVRNIGFDERFPCLVLDDTLFGNGAAAGCVIETDKLGHEAARMTAQILNAGSAQRIPLKDIAPVRMVDYGKFNSYRNFSGRIPLGTTVINKPDTMWTRHWQTFLTIFFVVLIVIVLQIFYLSWMRRRLRTSRNMLYSLPGRVLVLNRAENILFASWIKGDYREKAPKKLDQLLGIDYPKLARAVHEVFQSGKQMTIEYNYEDVHRAISFALLEHDIFGQDAVICFSLDNTELQQARRQAERYSAQLKKTTRMWDILINFLPIHIFAKDIDNDFRYVFNNRTRCKFYGVGENELNDKTDFDFLPQEVAEQRRREDEEFVKNPEGQMEANVDVTSWDGSVQHLRSIQRIFTDEDGTRLLLGTAINITELEEAHIQMQQLNSKLQELLQQHSILLDNMPSFVMTKDIDDDFRIITCNDACLKFLNQTPQSVAGKTDHDLLFNPEDADAIHADDLHAVEVLERRPEYHSTGRIHDRNGRTRIGNFYRKLIRTSDNRRILFTLFHDVTDLENAKREAEETADRFLLTLRSIGDGIITTDANGIVTMVNPNAENLLGCKQAEVLGRPHTDFFRIVHEQTGKNVTSPLTEALRYGKVTMGAEQTDLVSASGQRYHIAANASPIRSRSGEVTGAILVFRDVTEERNTMQDLESASELASLASFHYNLNTRIRTGSNLLCELWPTDENGNALLEEQFVYPEDIPLFKQNMRDLLEKTSDTVQFSFRIGTDASDLKYYRMKLTLDQRDPTGNSVTGIVQDVTEITLNMLKLKDTQALWDAAINAMPIMFTVKDLDDDCRYLLCNNAFSDIFNCTPDEITGKTDPELFVNVGNLDFSNRLNRLALTLDVNETREFEEELPVSDGSLRSIRTVIRVIRDTGGRRILLAASSDITEMVNAKRAAEENADRFLLTLRSIGDGIITTDAEGVVTMINPNAEALLGCRQLDALGKPHTDFFRIVHEQTGKPVVSPLTEALRSGEVANGADLTDLVSASGQRYHIASNAAPIHTRSGEVTGAILVFRDVTDERNKREELRRAMTSLENASNMARLASFRYEIKTRKRSGSSLLYSLWPNDENGEPIRFEDWVYPDDIPIFSRELEKMEKMEKPGETATFSFRIGQTSSLRYIRALVSLDLSNPDEPAVAGILQDVTELTLSMLKLKDTQALWDAAINAIPVMFTVKDVDHDFRYLLCNNAFANIFSHTPNEIIGKTDLELFENKDILDFARRMNNPNQEVNATVDFEEELPVGGEHQHVRFIKTVTRVIRDASGRRLLLAASNDVTDMQKLLTIERINTEMLSRFNREQVFDGVLDGIAEVLRKELCCARIVVVHKEKNGFIVYRQWQYDGLNPIKAERAGIILNMFDWEKRVRKSPLGSIIRIDGLQNVVDASGLTLDTGSRALEYSLISVPLYEKNRLSGGVFLTFLQDRRDFTDLDEAILISCGNIVSLARQRERNQQAIRQAMLENQLILDNIDIPIWLFNTENVLIRTNSAVSRVAGRPGELLDPAENDRVFRDFSANIKEPDVSIDALVRRSSRLKSTTYLGQDYIVVNDGVRDGQGNLLYNMVYAVDVTTMNQLIQNQRFGNEMLEEVISEDDFDICIRRTLENVCKLLGASRGCLLEHVEEGTKTHCIAEFVEPTHPHADFRMFGRTLSRVRGILENTDDKRTFVCSDIRTINWSRIAPEWGKASHAIDLRSIFLSNILLDGEIWGTVGFNYEGVTHKFTENDVGILRSMAHMIELVLSRKRAKEIIMDALSRAQAADKAKSFFIASVSHEIRTPLNSVIGFAELLREGGVSQKQEKEYLDAISSSANALLMLINDVLDLSKLEANQMQIITAYTDFNALCREVLLIFTFRAQENGNRLVSDVPEDLPELDVDNIRIRQILINLLGNAVKFTKKGAITLSVTFTPDVDSGDTGTLKCSVSDTGIGISEEDQKKLMEPFVQLSKMRGTNAVNNGTGLGLSISKRLATCMNGALTCTSTVGEGSTFSVTLNAVRYRAKAKPKKSAKGAEKTQAKLTVAPDSDVKSIRILVVDDVPMNLRVAKALFKKIGFANVSTAGSGKEALELLEKQPIDLILSDMWMPEMNGAQFSAAVKENPKFAHIPVVAQTADVETSGNFDMSHFDAIILKPLTGEKLTNMVKRIIEDGDLRKGEDGKPVNLG